MYSKRFVLKKRAQPDIISDAKHTDSNIFKNNPGLIY